MRGVVFLLACAVLLAAGSVTESAPASAEPVTADPSLPTAAEDAMPGPGVEFTVALNTGGDDESDSHRTVTTSPNT